MFILMYDPHEVRKGEDRQVPVVGVGEEKDKIFCGELRVVRIVCSCSFHPFTLALTEIHLLTCSSLLGVDKDGALLSGIGTAGKPKSLNRLQKRGTI